MDTNNTGEKKFENFKAFVMKHLPGSEIAVSIARMSYFMFMMAIRNAASCLKPQDLNGPSVARLIMDRLGERMDRFSQETQDRFIRYCRYFLRCLGYKEAASVENSPKWEWQQ